MNKLITYLLFLFVITIAAQTKKIDSLRSLCNMPKEDTNKVLALNNISYKFSKISLFDSTRKYSIAAINLSKKLNYIRGIAEGYKVLSVFHQNTGNYPEALKNLNIALKIYSSQGDKYSVAICYNSIGNIFHRQGNYTDALRAHFNALKLRIERMDSTGIAYSYVNIAKRTMFDSLGILTFRLTVYVICGCLRLLRSSQ